MRNNNLDILKILMAFLVIALHIFPVSRIGGIQGLISYEIASGITRIAVPTFFLISGYFLRNKLNDTAYLWKYIKRILLLYVVWQIIYLPDLYRFYNLGWFSNRNMILKLIYGYWHLWYLLATAIAVGLLYLSRNYSLNVKFLLLVLLLGIGYGYQIGMQSGNIHNLEVQFLYESIGTARNFLFFGFPMMLLGTLYDQWRGVISKFKKYYSLFWLVLLIEAGVYYKLQVKAMDFLLVLPLLSMLTFSIVKEKASFSDASINSTFSLGIYLTHPYAMRLVYEMFPQKTFGFIVVKYFLVSFTAILFWWILDKINKKIPYFF
ncbi:acyltransferase family protein [Flavobacterium davisii]|uniref:Acyltransferase family protein n=3 Tax=Flavobacterium TaxID=237 RepID=A0ABW8PMA9_9FLAO|nr:MULTISPECIES: acyltransferase family protein [Flavobacterium]QYS88521.1 acyltransferase family protein [Flavobacterium davisii]RVU91952.1 hypothetical protein EH230_00160 [Flavobacterium columnare]